MVNLFYGLPQDLQRVTWEMKQKMEEEEERSRHKVKMQVVLQELKKVTAKEERKRRTWLPQECYVTFRRRVWLGMKKSESTDDKAADVYMGSWSSLDIGSDTSSDIGSDIGNDIYYIEF